MIDFKNYFEAIEHGASRSRVLVQFLMLGTFLTFLGLYNSLMPSWNWLGSRIRSHHIAAEWVSFAGDTTRPDTVILRKDGQAVAQLPNRFLPTQFLDLARQARVSGLSDSVANAQLIAGWESRNVWIRFPRHMLTNKTERGLYNIDWERVDSVELGVAIGRLANLQCHDERELQWMLTNLHKAQMDNAMLIEVPILGLSFDVNSLAVISGMSFMILYFLLYYSLSRELKNIKLLFRIHRERGVTSRDIYQLLSMYQVLTIPRSIDRFLSPTHKKLAEDLMDLHADQNKRKRWLPMVPVVLPFMVWCTVFLYDLITKAAGSATNPSLTNTSAVLSGIIGCFVLISLLRCLGVWKSINREWDQKAREVVIDLNGGIGRPLVP